MYLLILVLALVTSYFLIALALSQLLVVKLVFNAKRIVLSLGIIILFTVITYFLAIRIPDAELSNRVLHALGGGFNVVLVTYLAIESFKISLNWRQFAIVAILFVCLLGIGNEILEFFMQEYLRFTFAATPTDTWLDLVSNSIGGVVGILGFSLLFVKSE